MRVPKRLTHAHPAIQAAKDFYQSPSYPYDMMLWLPVHALHAAALTVSKDQFQRGLRILNALLKACEKRGWKTGTERELRTHVNTVRIDGQTLSFRLRERCRQVERPLTDEDREDLRRGRPVYHARVLQPIGVLSLTIQPAAGAGPHDWEDHPERPLEAQLDAFLPSLSRTAEALAARQRHWARERARHEHEEALKQALREHQSRWRERSAQLWAEVSGWQRAEQGRAYLDRARRQLLDQGPPTPAQSLWMAWAATVIAASDPLVRLTKRDVGPWSDDHRINRCLQQRALAGESDRLPHWPFERGEVAAYFGIPGPEIGRRRVIGVMVNQRPRQSPHGRPPRYTEYPVSESGSPTMKRSTKRLTEHTLAALVESGAIHTPYIVEADDGGFYRVLASGNIDYRLEKKRGGERRFQSLDAAANCVRGLGMTRLRVRLQEFRAGQQPNLDSPIRG